MKPKVLIVEDEIVIALNAVQVVEELGYSVIGPVGSKSEAIRLMERGGFDAAIVDVRLRGGDLGADAVAQVIRRGVPVIIVTAYNDVDVLGPELSSCIVVRKPYFQEELKAALEVSLARGQG